MKVYIPTPLRSYTNSSIVEANGKTIIELLKDLNKRFPGIMFRIINEQEEIREHMRIFVNQNSIKELNFPINDSDEIQILQALSGG
ncbi:MAG: MoaD/ThiS family protein [Candidatus Hodarchaeales archaeon]|jgi:molybdopterin converting factor small subunit